MPAARAWYPASPLPQRRSPRGQMPTKSSKKATKGGATASGRKAARDRKAADPGAGGSASEAWRALLTSALAKGPLTPDHVYSAVPKLISDVAERQRVRDMMDPRLHKKP